MTDTTMHQEFEAWEDEHRDQTGFWPTRFESWQTATERATAIERERCAVVIKREADKTVSMAIFCGVESVDLRPYEICEAAIRQGGAE